MGVRELRVEDLKRKGFFTAENAEDAENKKKDGRRRMDDGRPSSFVYLPASFSVPLR